MGDLLLGNFVIYKRNRLSILEFGIYPTLEFGILKIGILESMIRKKPWNRINLPVYSVSSNGVKPNMHICTYVSAVSMLPKRMMVAIYHGTQTIENIEISGEFVLQLLAGDQYNLVTLLGKQTGKKIDKIRRLEKRKLLTEWNGFPVLQQALAVMHLKVLNEMEGGDHRMYLCDVTSYKNMHDGEALTKRILGEKGIIRV
jgi:flavin reductase (DIM6/NTAB) family NADH-FMN oxidoreductase RutF